MCTADPSTTCRPSTTCHWWALRGQSWTLREQPPSSRPSFPVMLRCVGLIARQPAPELQTSFFDGDGQQIGRSDFFFEGHGVIGEFDGKVKYGKYLRAGQQPGDAVYLEKLREDSLRDMGWEMVRWNWADLTRPAEVRARFERAFARRRAASCKPVGGFRRAV
ncbi:hypothetical protein [Antrihabitans cavernicola]|uniref:DUF559 domain-containing protein n=1 Tax=Antrihabitans cavernicola TaxID=2495913 RepID=A0A5A7SDG1_9NOCA|nr:hypothetical protein [Spelaeibacter cavernicola]KAA0024190.1 hypothetical protein FOY51_06510 [Spelaeibacter cavernicola]